ncbi:general substrate transporter [Tilletiaria anomala UBC 951]|uniref:General substrate transporter n=1 Tax=Tilletiaria anomala (strain ATCC 24038 / CBS 436.72 / UBC 951) TaxID=1037660 RepID=A0A066VDQ9_TILAU|nr:general substrate transporter [Tilletiaria anomala UBC 951]KDN39621.1 general substrate transporter [Tilletiaria anomala UBC 951]
MHTVPITPGALDRHPHVEDEECREQDALGDDDDFLGESAGGFSPYLGRLALIACLSGLQFGMDTGVASGMLVAIRGDLGHTLSSGEQELIVSATTIGAIVGSIGASSLSDWLGRKSVMITAAVCFLLGSLEQGASQVVRELVLGRLIQGLAVGMASMVTPTYLAEVAPTSIRGRLVGLNSLLITGGQVLAYALDAIFYNAPHGWRWMVLSGAVPAIVQLLGLFALDESPRWLVSKGRISGARKVLQKIYPEASFAQVDEQIKRIQRSFSSDTAYEAMAARAAARIDAEVAAVAPSPTTSVVRQVISSRLQLPAARLPNVSGAAEKAKGKFELLLKDKANRKALILACGLQFFQQACGFNSLMYFSGRLLLMAGFSKNPNATAIGIAVANMVGTIGAMRLVDSLGRRKLLLWTTAAAAVSLMLLAGSFSLIRMEDVTDGFQPTAGAGSGASGDPEGVQGWAYVSLAAMVLFTLFYALGLGIVPWLVQSEVFSSPVRSLGGGCATAVNWIANLLISATYLDIVRLITAAGSFWLFSAIAVLAWIFTYFRLPELSGVSINDVSEAFGEREERSRGAYIAVHTEVDTDDA